MRRHGGLRLLQAGSVFLLVAGILALASALHLRRGRARLEETTALTPKRSGERRVVNRMELGKTLTCEIGAVFPSIDPYPTARFLLQNDFRTTTTVESVKKHCACSAVQILPEERRVSPGQLLSVEFGPNSSELNKGGAFSGMVGLMLKTADKEGMIALAYEGFSVPPARSSLKYIGFVDLEPGTPSERVSVWIAFPLLTRVDGKIAAGSRDTAFHIETPPGATCRWIANPEAATEKGQAAVLSNGVAIPAHLSKVWRRGTYESVVLSDGKEIAGWQMDLFEVRVDNPTTNTKGIIAIRNKYGAIEIPVSVSILPQVMEKDEGQYR